jgi:hypothetical protein
MAPARRKPTAGSSPRDAVDEASNVGSEAGVRSTAGGDPAIDRESVERERAADLLVQLAGARIRDDIDAADPRHDRLLAWLATEARAALSPAERAQLARDGEALLERVRARRGDARSDSRSDSRSEARSDDSSDAAT